MNDPKDDEGGQPRIVETRRFALSPHESRRGILRPAAEGSVFRLERFQPQGDLRLYVDRFWSVRWDLRGRAPYEQETLPHPCVNLAVEEGKSAVYASHLYARCGEMLANGNTSGPMMHGCENWSATCCTPMMRAGCCAEMMGGGGMMHGSDCCGVDR